MLMARLMLNDNQVIISSRHFNNLDKLVPVGEGKWTPFELNESYNWWRHVPVGAAHQFERCTRWPFSDSFLSRWFRRHSLVETVIDVLQFKSWRVKEGLDGCPAGLGLPAKYTSVDAFFSLWDQHRVFMTKHRVLLNDPYFFMLLGRVRLVHPKNVQWQSENECLINGKKEHVDLRLKIPDRAPVSVEFECEGESSWTYKYSEHLLGVWSVNNPNAYFVGHTRPTTGAFAQTGEAYCWLVWRLISDPVFRHTMMASYPKHLENWRKHAMDTDTFSRPSGASVYDVGNLLGIEPSFIRSLLSGRLAEYLVGPIFPARYTSLQGDFQNPAAYATYQRLCRDVCAPLMPVKRAVGHLVWFPLLSLNISVLVSQHGCKRLAALAAVAAFTPAVNWRVSRMTYPTFTYGMPSAIFPRIACTSLACLMANLAAGHFNIFPATCTSLVRLALTMFLRSGIPLVGLVASVCIYLSVGKRIWFNDLRGKAAYAKRFEENVGEMQQTDWFKKANA